MGVYVYTMRAASTNIQVDGTPVKANLLKYSFKPFWDDEANKRFQRILTRAENFWDEHETPDVFVIGDKFENGAYVRRGWPKHTAWCYDSEWPGEHVGYLKKVGRTWTTVATEAECHGI